MVRYDEPHELSAVTRTPTGKRDVHQISMKIPAPLDRTRETTRTRKSCRSLEPVATLADRGGKLATHVRDNSITHSARIATVTP